MTACLLLPMLLGPWECRGSCLENRPCLYQLSLFDATAIPLLLYAYLCPGHRQNAGSYHLDDPVGGLELCNKGFGFRVWGLSG